MTDTPRAEPVTRVVASVLGLSAFTVAVVAGLASGAGTAPLLGRAVISASVCYLVGAGLGSAGGRAVREYAARYREDNPVPDAPSESSLRAAELAARAARAGAQQAGS